MPNTVRYWELAFQRKYVVFSLELSIMLLMKTKFFASQLNWKFVCIFIACYFCIPFHKPYTFSLRFFFFFSPWLLGI